MGDDDLDLLHVGHHRGMTTDVAGVYRVRLRTLTASPLPGGAPRLGVSRSTGRNRGRRSPPGPRSVWALTAPDAEPHAPNDESIESPRTRFTAAPIGIYLLMPQPDGVVLIPVLITTLAR